jgi:hypothetical protein
MISVVRKELRKRGIDIVDSTSQNEAFHSVVRKLLSAKGRLRRRVASIVGSVHCRPMEREKEKKEQGRVRHKL